MTEEDRPELRAAIDAATRSVAAAMDVPLSMLVFTTAPLTPGRVPTPAEEGVRNTWQDLAKAPLPDPNANRATPRCSCPPDPEAPWRGRTETVGAHHRQDCTLRTQMSPDLRTRMETLADRLEELARGRDREVERLGGSRLDGDVVIRVWARAAAETLHTAAAEIRAELAGPVTGAQQVVQVYEDDNGATHVLAGVVEAVPRLDLNDPPGDCCRSYRLSAGMVHQLDCPGDL